LPGNTGDSLLHAPDLVLMQAWTLPQWGVLRQINQCSTKLNDQIVDLECPKRVASVWLFYLSMSEHNEFSPSCDYEAVFFEPVTVVE
jgi:hypothetical protein